MIPTYRNSSSPSFPFELNNSNEVHDLNHSQVCPNYQFASSCQTFFNSTIDHHDQTRYYHSELYQPQPQPEVDKYGSRSGSNDVEMKKHKALKLTLWKKGERYEKVKNLEGASKIEVKPTNKMKLEDAVEADYSSSNYSNNNPPIRVCSDCNTTKTPLWRSGPKGPKSLCNACGIRQRKARRAMAAATAAANGTNFTTETSTTTMKIKVQQKHKITKVDTNNVVPFKKRCKFITSTTTTSTSTSPAGSSSSTNNAKKKLCFEDFLINFTNNLAIHRVFPQDEKEAAILLMAISSGLVHG